ncbi:FAD-dependent monooxygenase [Dactylosporangium sp. CS-033363]|uniref:FAD-dependent monooxygenase n=1 Tax=Dactylosporangium sp. CS-033363 TaxID=3239935 RepID=UPI003D8B6ADF
METVLIVGAGPTGLTLACTLARAGVPFRIVDAAPGPQPGSRGKGLQPRTLEVFADLGIADRVLAHGRTGMPIHSTGPDGQVKVSIPDMPASLITPQWRTEEALRMRLEELGGAVEFGTAYAAHDMPNARWVVGCDGGHSAVRKGAGIGFVGDTRDEIRMIVADVAADGLDRDAWHVWRHAEGMLALCPLPSTDVFQFQASIAPGQDPDLSLANLRAILERRTGRADLKLHEPQWSSLWRANVRLAERYRAGNVFLAGDAAHIHSPAGGQGMNTGIQDAYNLGWKLAAAAHGAPESLLDTYEAERRPVAAGVLALSDARLRQAIEERGIPTQRDASTTQLGIGYRGSVLARDDRDDTSAVRAGDRAPGGAPTGGQWTLLSFGPEGAPAGVRAVRAQLGSDLAAAYAATARTVVLIRPDGYVGMISDAGDVSAVSDYLAEIGGAVH